VDKARLNFDQRSRSNTKFKTMSLGQHFKILGNHPSAAIVDLADPGSQSDVPTKNPRPLPAPGLFFRGFIIGVVIMTPIWLVVIWAILR
jgi:hypothetical protein